MSRKVFKLLVRLAVLAGLVWLGRVALKRWVDGPDIPKDRGSWPPSRPTLKSVPVEPAVANGRATEEAEVSPVVAAKTAAPPAAADEKTGAAKVSGAGQKAKKAPTAKAAPAGQKTPAKADGAADRTWVTPDGSGTAPPSHPVKAKMGSRLYHLPGMAAYERTKPDRCYATPEAAEADGFTRSKR